jgi:hypothetical protein
MVREMEGQFEIMGQGSRIDTLGTAWSSCRGDVITIESDLQTLQAFSKVAPRCELPDYRIVLTIPPGNLVKERHRAKELRSSANKLRTSTSEEPKILVPSQRSEDPPYILPYDTDPPKYLRQTAASPVLERSPDRPTYVKDAES